MRPESLFLAVLTGGIVCLVSGLFVTRQNWRADIRPYGRDHRSVDLMLHPERYARAEVVGRIRLLNGLGALLLACALSAVVWELLRAGSTR